LKGCIIRLDYNTPAIDERRPLMVRSAAQRRVSNHDSLRPSFGTRSLRSAPQDEEFEFSLDARELDSMTEAAAEKLKSLGWSSVDASGFIALVGPLWQRVVDGVHEYALIAEDKHHNRRGVVQGGVLMTFADRSCGMTGRFVSGSPSLATVQFDTQFVDAAKIGEVLVSRPRVIRSTRSLIFLTTELTASERCVAMASGVFKVMKS
jgi:acyl-coenzyme A thioesterase PaaI-like protein